MLRCKGIYANAVDFSPFFHLRLFQNVRFRNSFPRSLLRLWIFAALYAAKIPINGLLTEFAG
jgi:hypothetical protein